MVKVFIKVWRDLRKLKKVHFSDFYKKNKSCHEILQNVLKCTFFCSLSRFRNNTNIINVLI
jgi:hypothetical protein